MKAIIFAISLLVSSLSFSLAEPNNRPIIGILSQRIPSSLDAMLPEGHNFTTYIAASYVKWVEAAGARVVPIVVRSDPANLEFYTKMFAAISGLLIPGGAVSIHSSPYAEASNFFFDLAKMDNDAGDTFPIWGTCLGFEMLALMANDNVPNLKRCNSYDQTLPLDLLEGWKDSNLLGEADSTIMDYLTRLPVTSNFHHWCLTRENFTLEAVKVAQYFSEFFIDLARQSSHKFESRTEEEKFLIYNYQPFYSGPEGRDFGFQQVYVF